jgi:thiol-disulfide isomerase/thioredoxin
MLEKNKDIVFVPHNQKAIRNKELDFVNAFARKYGYMPFRFGRGFKDTASITKDYKTGIDFLQSYSSAHKLSKEFTEASKKTLYYEKLSNIIESSRMSKSELSGSFFKNFQCDECLKLGVSNYIGAFYAFSAFNKWTQTQAFDFAEKNYTGLSKTTLLHNIIFPQTGFSSDFSKLHDTAFTNSLNRQVALVEKNITIDQKLQIVDQANRIRSFKEVITAYKGQVTYVDFWASWCAPCRREIPLSAKLHEAYADKGVNFIYISTDEDLGSWQRACKNEKLPPSACYIMPKGKESAIAKQFEINTIPRYMLIGKDGKIIDTDAPRPSDPKIRKIFDGLLKN